MDAHDSDAEATPPPQGPLGAEEDMAEAERPSRELLVCYQDALWASLAALRRRSCGASCTSEEALGHLVHLRGLCLGLQMARAAAGTGGPQ